VTKKYVIFMQIYDIAGLTSEEMNKRRFNCPECGVVVWRGCVSTMRECLKESSEDLCNQESNQF